MGFIDATYSAVSVMYTGSGNAAIQSMVRFGDAKTNPGSPFCIVHVTPMRAMNTSGMNVVRVVFEVQVPRAHDFTRHDAIITQLKSDYNGITPATAGGYDFSPMVWMSSEQRNNVDERVIRETYDLLVFTSGTDAPFLGYEAGISGYDGGRAFYWELNEGAPFEDVTEFADSRRRYALGDRTGSGIMRFYTTDVPPSQFDDTAHLVATVYAAVFTLSSGVTLSRNIVVGPSRNVVSFGRNNPQIYEVPFRVTEVDP